jgi:hypothetical protein
VTACNNSFDGHFACSAVSNVEVRCHDAKSYAFTDDKGNKKSHYLIIQGNKFKPQTKKRNSTFGL